MILTQAIAVALSTLGLSPAEPVNTHCPIGKEPIVESAGTVEHDGKTVGFCCPSCNAAFGAWGEERKDEFVAMAVAMEDPEAKPAAEEAVAAASDEEVIEAQLMHYPIDTCIVAGGKLGSMGDPVNYVHEGRLIRFCCAGCIGKFEADPEKYLTKLDEQIVAAQVEGYPMSTCAVAGAELGSMGDPIDYIYQNRLVRFCCAGCVGPFTDDPDQYIANLDAAYADAQRESYPLDTCVVAGGKLGSMGEPVELIAGSTLVRFCCGGCVPDFKNDPSEFLSKLPQD